MSANGDFPVSATAEYAKRLWSRHSIASVSADFEKMSVEHDLMYLELAISCHLSIQDSCAASAQETCLQRRWKITNTIQGARAVHLLTNMRGLTSGISSLAVQ